jgi:hypothetical protein
VVARRLEFGDSKSLGEAESLGEEVSKMLASFIQTLGNGTKKLKADS